MQSKGSLHPNFNNITLMYLAVHLISWR